MQIMKFHKWLFRNTDAGTAIESENIAFQNLMMRANYFADRKNVAALEDLQKLVMRPIQSLRMVDVYFKEDHKSQGTFHIWNDIGLNYIPGLGTSFISHLIDNRIDNERLPVAKLGSDIVLPSGWSPASIMNSLGKIGDGRPLGTWVQDANHQLHFWYPLNLFWVGGGNHSITVGIILSEGTIKPVEGYDLSKLYKYVNFDGQNWRDSHTGKVIGIPLYKELGYVYEIGRLILQVKISPND